MTDVAPLPPTLVPARGPLDQDWRKVVRQGLLVALALVFVSLAGMPVGLDGRVMIEPVLSMGHLALLWIPLMVGYSVSKEKALEGVQVHAKGGREVAAGLVVGAVGGAGLSVLAVLLDHFDLRDPLVNWNPNLFEFLTFDRGAGYGLVWVAIGGGLGLLGGLLHLLPAILRRAVTVTIVAVIAVAGLEAVLIDMTDGLGIDWLADWLFFIRGGLNLHGAATVALLAALFAAFGRRPAQVTRQRFAALEGPTRTTANVGLLVVVVAAVVVLPQLLGSITNELLVNVGLFVLLALGLNIVVGLAGILDLGYVAFFAVGGYTAAVLTSPNSPGFSPELPWAVALLVVVVLAALTGLFIGAPVIRMRGDYLAIVTLGFGEIIRLLFLSDWLSGYTGGAQGITNIPGVDLGFTTLSGIDPKGMFYLVLGFCLLAVYVSWRLEHSRVGRAWMAIREDESVAEAMGINTVNVKLLAFVVGAVLASFSGAIFAAKVGSIFPNSFVILVSIVILVVVIVGGIGNIVGVIVGAAVLIGVLGGPRQPGLLQEFSEYKLLVYGALLVWMMLKRPEGLVPNVRRTRELHQEEFLQDAWLKGHIDTGEDHDEGEVAPA